MPSGEDIITATYLHTYHSHSRRTNNTKSDGSLPQFTPINIKILHSGNEIINWKTNKNYMCLELENE